MANKRDIIAARINEGGATQEILMEVAKVNKAGLASQFTYLRLTSKYPVKGEDGIFSFITAEEWEAKKASAGTRGASVPKKAPEERQSLLLKRQARLQDIFSKKEETFKKEATEKNRLRLQKAEAEILLCNIEVDEVNDELIQVLKTRNG